MNIKNIMIAGGGTLGSQIAWQCAVKGFNVTVYDAYENGIKSSKENHIRFAEDFINEGRIDETT
ncbi:3-hydroxyacyl-CoA dehydrogenase NAD-binding domain-containing protein [Flammeovirga sp. OC4]|uniref:3-hydroxyacyl-CoA dehydrogenase NAD-binding domain-containing protein n=1 Tax=Flammeovirga sp. OC4 TaxID=1382345 RepID=UPI0005C59912|nr:3-hydroxyacyl-CoA dehydrogenase NAD-binding domain-containing protein [Flammeovirga sp. OC4]